MNPDQESVFLIIYVYELPKGQEIKTSILSIILQITLHFHGNEFINFIRINDIN